MSSRDTLVLDAISGRKPSSTGWIRADCPFCELKIGKPDRKQCLGFEAHTGRWHCFRCGSAGLVHDIDAPMPEKKTDAVAPSIELPDGFFELYREPGRSSWMADGARAYLAARGIDEAIGREARIGACLAGRYRGRVVVPVYAPGGALVGWSARDFVGGSDRKYLYPAGMRRAVIMFNAAALLEETNDPVFVVEGVFDALAMWPDAVACLGKPSDAQVDMLLATSRPIITLLDGDAWRESWQLSLSLRAQGKRVGSIRLGASEDPATTDLEAVRRSVPKALETPAQVWATRDG